MYIYIYIYIYTHTHTHTDTHTHTHNNFLIFRKVVEICWMRCFELVIISASLIIVLVNIWTSEKKDDFSLNENVASFNNAICWHTISHLTTSFNMQRVSFLYCCWPSVPLEVSQWWWPARVSYNSGGSFLLLLDKICASSTSVTATLFENKNKFNHI